MTRAGSIFLLTLILVATGCTDRDCLRTPTEDSTTPSITVRIVYGRMDSPAIDTLTVTLSDSARYLDARSDERLRVAFRAYDAEGLKSLRMGAALLTTVGAGLESKRIPVEPVTSSCPRAELMGKWTSPPADAGARIRIGVAAENWAGLRSSTEPVTIRLRQTRY